MPVINLVLLVCVTRSVAFKLSLGAEVADAIKNSAAPVPDGRQEEV